MKTKMFLLMIICACMIIQAQSYEGYISGNLPVWIDLNAPANDGTLSGSYFYKAKTGTITLTGSKKDSTLILNETDNTGAVTGIFNFVDYGDSLSGKWQNPKSGKFLPVAAFKTDPAFKTSARIPGINKLMLADGKSTLKSVLVGGTLEKGKLPKVIYSFAERGIISCNFEWQTMGAYPSSGIEYHTFDAATAKEITLLQEIKDTQLPKLLNKIKEQLQAGLDAYRKTHTNDEWLEAFPDQATLDSAFKVGEPTDKLCDNFCLDNRTFFIVIDNFFDLPHAAQEMDYSVKIPVPLSELLSYLRDDSIFQRLK
jgi:hypothetical protein